MTKENNKARKKKAPQTNLVSPLKPRENCGKITEYSVSL